MKVVNTFDIDGVIDLGDLGGFYPGPDDVIITGRSYQESKETYEMLEEKGIKNHVFFNPIRKKDKTRQTSGIHKGNVIKSLKSWGIPHGFHAEDDAIQIEEILRIDPSIRIVHVKHNYTKK
jgi:hypothetical protein